MEGASLGNLSGAPEDTLVYVQDTPVPLVFGSAYVIRTRQITVSDGSTCVYYAKAQLAGADLGSCRVSLVFDANPRCYDRGLTPDS